jgi:pimeloyl-ACP methyl ester carboxylesterase
MSTVRIHGLQLAYEDVGTGPPVVLLHGYPFNRSLWAPQVEALKSSYRIVTPDLRGFGDSEIAPTATMKEMAADIAALMDHLGIRRAMLVGLSMGGYVALAFYRQFELSVRGLILADTRPQGDTEEGKLARAQQAKQILMEGMPVIADNMLPKLLHPETVSKRPGVVRRVREMILQTKPAGAVAALQGMATREDHTEFLSRIIVPTLIVVGSDDAITPLQDAETMHQKIRGSRLVTIDNAGHVSNLEQPDKFNQEVVDFLSQ